MQTTVHTADELPGWDAFNAASDQGTVFSSLPWLKQYADRHDAALTFLAVTDGDNINAGIPLLTRQKLGHNIVTTTPLSPYNGLILEESLSREAHIHDTLRDLLHTGLNDYGFVALSLHPSFTDMRPFMWKNWRVSKLYTYWVDITSEEACWNNYSQSLRRKVRRAHDDGITVKEHEDPALLSKQYGHSYHRHGISEPIPPDKLEAWSSELLSSGLGTMFAAFDSTGEPIATRLVVPDKPFVYDWLAGSSEKGDAHSANHTLVADIMQHYAQNGYSTFDFRGANTPGVIEFKRSFGGVLIAYHQAEFRNSALLSFAERVRGALTSWRRGL